jgi:hypothetical protein
MLRDRNEVLKEIQASSKLSEIFYGWEENEQEEFLNICTGVKGVKILYDAFFKEVMNPENAPERLNELLSLLLKRTVKIHTVLPGDSTRIADESSLLIMDILVEFEDKSLANVEVQKIGYHFPGQRSACYSADLLLRQYKRVKGERKNNFSYRDIKSVYTIVFFEKSTKEFKKFPNYFLHYFEQKSNTGLEIDLLQKYLFIPLDIYKKNKYNNDIDERLEAWLEFFSTDSPEEILELIEKYPDFRCLYEEMFTLCSNVERMMEMWSEELLQLDKNTVQYMIDEMQEEIDTQKSQLEEQQNQLLEKDDRLLKQQNQLLEKDDRLQNQQNQLNEKDMIILELQKQLKALREK